MRQVPTLLIDGVTLTQSLPIIEYLDETRPQKRLLPQDPVRRAQARQIAEMVNSGIQPLQNLSARNLVVVYTGDKCKETPWASHWITTGFLGIEKMLSRTASRFCVGDEVTIADLCLVGQIHGAYRFKVDMSLFPTINRVVVECGKLEAFQKADSSCQPDTPKKTK